MLLRLFSMAKMLEGPTNNVRGTHIFYYAYCTAARSGVPPACGDDPRGAPVHDPAAGHWPCAGRCAAIAARVRPRTRCGSGHDPLMALHEGNIARYRLRPSEFAAWRVEWER